MNSHYRWPYVITCSMKPMLGGGFTAYIAQTLIHRFQSHQIPIVALDQNQSEFKLVTLNQLDLVEMNKLADVIIQHPDFQMIYHGKK